MDLKQNPPCLLALADGTLWPGRAFGASGERTGEICFNTSITGYQEVLTDPSYHGQIVVMTQPHIGNYGANDDDESRRAWVSGFVVRDASPIASSWRATQSLHDYLCQRGIIAISEVDTRVLVRHIRAYGAQNAALSSVDPVYKLKFGHRGGNQPVKYLPTGRVEISSHNHGFAVHAARLPPGVEVTHLNLNDGCVEGLRAPALRAFSVQYHPEAAPGLHDALYLFDQFIELMKG